MLEIERISWRTRRYAVRYHGGRRGGIWERRRLGEGMTGEIDGHRFEVRRNGRRQFTLTSAGLVLASVDAARRGRWTISAAGSVCELRQKGAWRSEMELCRGAIAVGSIRKGRSRRKGVRCALPAELSPAVQAFIGFIVLILLTRAAASLASSGAAVVGASG